MLMTTDRREAAQVISWYTRCGSDHAEAWVMQSEIPDEYLRWFADTLATLPLPRAREIKHKPVIGVCECCGSEFGYEWTTRPRRYCSRACQQKAYRQRTKLKTSRKHKVKSSRGRKARAN